MRRVIAFAPLLAGLAACSPYAPDLGSEPFLCGDSAPVCPDGYACTANVTGQMVCTPNGGPTGVDAGSSHPGACSDDSKLEPNDTITDAFQTTVATSRSSIDLADLAICPAGDVDTYEFAVSDQQNASATVTYAASGTALQMTMLNSGGSVIATAAGSGADTLFEMVANLNSGMFYIQVSAATAGGENPNYELKLSVTGP